VKVSFKLSTIALLMVTLTSCSFAPKFERPAAPIPDHWNQTNTVSTSAKAVMDWKTFVTDESLLKLIQLALDNNRDLRQTLLNVEAVRAQYQIQRADRVPNINAQGSVTRQQVTGDISTTGRAQIQETWQAGVGLAAFELDLFGRVRNQSEAALQEYLATDDASKSAQISLVAEVIQAYLIRDGAQRRYQLTSKTLQTRETSLGLMQKRQEVGVTSALDYEEAQGLVAQAKADLERIDREVRQSSNALSLLIGVKDISAYMKEPSASNTMPVQEISAGAPSDLLLSRPDIQAAEHRLRARGADIGAARAAFFPRISLTGFFGSSSPELSGLFSSGQRSWSFMPQISLPIFDGGRNQANMELATVRRDIAVADYEKSIQLAFWETSDSLVAIDTLRREESARLTLTGSNQNALKLAEARHRAGVDNHLRYLDAQRNLFSSEILLIETSTQRKIALATLWVRLGGGWKASNQQKVSVGGAG
jgi:multidrug efflux system outer membrane protein